MWLNSCEKLVQNGNLWCLITPPKEFFSRIMETRGLSKEAALQHIQDLRAEWA